MLLAVGAAIGLLLGYGTCRVEPSVRAQVLFAQVEGLTEGVAILVGGREIGQVTAIQLVPAGAAPALLGERGGVAVHVRIAARHAALAPVDGAYFIARRGVLGERYLAIAPPEDGASRAIRDGDRIRGIDPPQMDRVLLRSYRNLLIAEQFTEQVGPSARALGASLSRLAATLQQVEPEPGALAAAGAAIALAVDEAGAVADAWRRGAFDPAAIPGLVERAGRAAASLERAVADARLRIDALQRELSRIGTGARRGDTARLIASLARARDALGTLERTIASARELAALVRAGEGTIGGLLNDPEFSDDAKQVGRLIKRQPWKLIGRPRRSVD